MNKLKSRTDIFSAAAEHASARSHRPVMLCIAAAAVGYISAFGRMAGYASYMSVACAAVAGGYSPAVFVGAAAGCAVTGAYADCAVQLGSILIIAALNVFFPDHTKNGEPIRTALWTAAITLLLSSIACMVSPLSQGGYPAAIRMINSLMCSCSVYAAAFIRQSARSGRILRVRGLNAVYLAMLYIMTVATLCSVSVSVFNIGRVLGCMSVPLAAKKRRAAGGAVIGALTAVSVMLCSSYLSKNAMLLAAAGLICSAFCDIGRLPAALAFMISASAAMATTGLNSDTFNMLADIIAGTVLFAAMPSGAVEKLFSRILVFSDTADSAGQTASSRLTFASGTISDIREKLAFVSDTVQARAENVTLGDRLAAAACPDCRLYDECRRNGSSAQLAACCNKMNGSTGFRPAGCIRADELDDIMKKCIAEELSDRAEAARLREMRLLLREQLGSVSDILNDLSCRLSRRREVDNTLSAAAKNYFEKEGFNGVRACVYTDENRCRRVEIYLSGEYEPEALSLTAGLCRAIECDLELPGITSANRMTKLEFDEIPPFRADLGSYSASRSDISCSGDTLETVECSAGEKYILLSDGMGSGKRARLDSAMSVGLAARMLRSGLTMTTCQRMINSVMRVKEWEESFATLDFLRLDLFSGRAEFLKSGAAPAYLCRDGGMIRIDCDSYPAGILADCEPDVSSCKLFDGDTLLLASDGAPESALLKASEIVYDNHDADAAELAFMIGSLCSEEAGEMRDDITVAAVKISLNKSRAAICGN